MFFELYKGVKGAVAQYQSLGFTSKGQAESLAVDGVAELAIKNDTGVLNVSIGTASASYNIHLHGGNGVIAKGFGSATLTATKDNASTVNVYYEAGVIKIQNKTAGTVSATIKYLG